MRETTRNTASRMGLNRSAVCGRVRDVSQNVQASLGAITAAVRTRHRMYIYAENHS